MKNPAIAAAIAAFALVAGLAPGVTAPGRADLRETPLGEATGFYHTEAIGGVDWVIDPAGRATTVCGIDHVRPNGWKDRNLGYDVYGRFVETNYPSREAWVAETLDRLGDWGFPALDTGRPCLYGAGQRFRTQAERARASALYARLLSSLPFMAGHVFFMFLDQPASGISETFREDSNYGLINEFGVPYPEITAALRAVNAQADALHAENSHRDTETQRENLTQSAQRNNLCASVSLCDKKNRGLRARKNSVPLRLCVRITATGVSQTPLSAFQAQLAQDRPRTKSPLTATPSARSSRASNGKARPALFGPKPRA